MAALSSRDRVFKIAELVSSILSELDPIFLLTDIRAVCKSWRHIVETDPLILWKTWGNSAFGDNPPNSIRGSYINRNCLCKPSEETGGIGMIEWKCEEHAYTDFFEINPAAIRLLELTWKRMMKVSEHRYDDGREIPDCEDFNLAQIKRREQDIDRMRPVHDYIDRKMEQFKYMREKTLERHSTTASAPSSFESCPTVNLIRPISTAKLINIDNTKRRMWCFSRVVFERDRRENLAALFQAGLFDHATDGDSCNPPLSIDKPSRMMLNMIENPVKMSLPSRQSRRRGLVTYDFMIRIFGHKCGPRRVYFSERDRNRILNTREREDRFINSNPYLTDADFQRRRLDVDTMLSDCETESRRGLENTELYISFSRKKPYDLISITTRRVTTMITILGYGTEAMAHFVYD